MRKKLTTEEFINKSKIIHNDKYDYSNSIYIGTFENVKIICEFHGEFEQRANNHLNGSGCPKCGDYNMKEKQKDKDFIEKSKKIHGEKYDYSLVNYINNRTKVKLICNICGNIVEQTPTNNLRFDCPYCSERIFDKKKFIENVNKIHNNKYDYSKINYSGAKNKIIIICPIHGEFKQRAGHHLVCGCSKCSNKHKYTTQEFIELVNIVHDFKYNYELVDYKNIKTKIKIICPEHGIFEQTPSSHLRGRGCSCCCESKGEKIIEKLLKSNKIEYVRQKTFDDCRNERLLYFDFYLPDKNTCIEFDGKQHFESIVYWGGEKHFEIVKKCDKIKNDYCHNNSINLIRIKYTDDIKEVLSNCGMGLPKID